ncbi:MAG: sigma-70 family RNA polymerase sigma factor [Alphaproteobacteria bacterium]|nr:sigma-70 family RNA polymerase sigma factor [Alphaproteobacteria bacterium]
MMVDERDPWTPLMDAALKGDRRAYECLLRDVTPVIHRFVRRQWSSAQASDVDDIVQETLRSLHAVRHTFQAGRPFLPWLLAIARHRLLDHRRVLVRQQSRERPIKPADEILWTVPTNTVHEGSVSAAALRHAIARLPPRQRLAIDLMGLKELSLKEASAQSGMSVAALKVASHRAIRSLRKAFGTEDR